MTAWRNGLKSQVSHFEIYSAIDCSCSNKIRFLERGRRWANINDAKSLLKSEYEVSLLDIYTQMRRGETYSGSIITIEDKKCPAESSNEDPLFPSNVSGRLTLYSFETTPAGRSEKESNKETIPASMKEIDTFPIKSLTNQTFYDKVKKLSKQSKNK